MENRLLEAEQQLTLLETVVAQAKETVLITSPELDPPGPEILFVNPAFSKMTGYNQEEVWHKTPRILQGPKSDRAMLQRLREALSRGEPFSGETVNYRKDGGEYYVEWDITPIRTSGGEISHFLSIQRNVTARKVAENQLREMFHQVEKSRNDLLSILNELRIGTAMTDENGHVVFLSAAARQLFGALEDGGPGGHWNELSVWIPKTPPSYRRSSDNRRKSERRFRFIWTGPTAGGSGLKWMSKTIPEGCAARFSFSTM